MKAAAWTEIPAFPRVLSLMSLPHKVPEVKLRPQTWKPLFFHCPCSRDSGSVITTKNTARFKNILSPDSLRLLGRMLWRKRRVGQVHRTPCRPHAAEYVRRGKQLCDEQRKQRPRYGSRATAAQSPGGPRWPLCPQKEPRYQGWSAFC